MSEIQIKCDIKTSTFMKINCETKYSCTIVNIIAFVMPFYCTECGKGIMKSCTIEPIVKQTPLIHYEANNKVNYLSLHTREIALVINTVLSAKHVMHAGEKPSECIQWKRFSTAYKLINTSEL